MRSEDGILTKITGNQKISLTLLDDDGVASLGTDPALQFSELVHVRAGSETKSRN